MSLSTETCAQAALADTPADHGTSGQAESSALLSIPAELRIMIWEHAVVDPVLLDRRHQPGCKFYRPGMEGLARPVITLQRCKNGSLESELAPSTLEKCRRRCLRRKGMTMLLVNKQVHEEAWSYFWKNNRFTFMDGGDMLRVMNSWPDITFESVGDIALYELHQVGEPADFGEAARKVDFKLLDKLALCENLRRLEIPARIAASVMKLHLDKLLRQVKTLAELVLSVLHDDPVPRRCWDPSALHIALSAVCKPRQLLPCLHGICKTQRTIVFGPGPVYCSQCREASKTVQTTASTLVGTWRSSPPRVETEVQFAMAAAKLQSLDSSCGVQGSITTSVCIDGNERQITCWRLPTLPASTSIPLKEATAPGRAKHRRKRVAHRTEAEDDHGAEVESREDVAREKKLARKRLSRKKREDD